MRQPWPGPTGLLAQLRMIHPRRACVYASGGVKLICPGASFRMLSKIKAPGMLGSFGCLYCVLCGILERGVHSLCCRLLDVPHFRLPLDFIVQFLCLMKFSTFISVSLRQVFILST